jgi:Uma2 family endonuclease
MTVTIPIQQLSFEEYLAYDDGTDTRYELVNGELEPMNPPTFRHLFIAKFLEQNLDSEITRLCLPWLCFREAGVRTGWRKSRLTDVYVVRADQVTGMLDQSAVCQTSPLLVVEIVSPDSIKRDYRFKRSEYAALEIPEYWIVDPLALKISVLCWEDGLYEESVFVGKEAIASKIFPELNLTVDRVLAAGDSKSERTQRSE